MINLIFYAVCIIIVLLISPFVILLICGMPFTYRNSLIMIKQCFTNKKRYGELVDATLSVFVAGSLAGGYFNLIGINGDQNTLLHPWVMYFCLLGIFACLFVKEVIDPKSN